MLYKNIKTFLFILVAMLVFALIFSNIYSCSIRRSDSKRAERLEQRATELENNLAESDRIRTEAIGALREAEGELSRLRDALRETEEYIAGLRNENSRLRDSIAELADIHGKFTSETVGLEELAQRIGDGAREALGIVERLQAGSGGTD